MARSHHRKKHKEHLQQFKHKGDMTTSTAKTPASRIMTVVGALTGFVIGYLSSNGSILWMAVGLVGGGLVGYWLGRRMDQGQ